MPGSTVALATVQIGLMKQSFWWLSKGVVVMKQAAFGPDFASSEQRRPDNLVGVVEHHLGLNFSLLLDSTKMVTESQPLSLLQCFLSGSNKVSQLTK